jgi:hypothetical protein
MNNVPLAQAVFAWFAMHARYRELAVQCRSAHVLETEHVGTGLLVRVATSAPGAKPVPFREGLIGPLINSPALPSGATVHLVLERGYISELEFSARGGAAFPADEFQFTLVDEDPRRGHAG